jgi:hypothetical protein
VHCGVFLLRQQKRGTGYPIEFLGSSSSRLNQASEGIAGKSTCQKQFGIISDWADQLTLNLCADPLSQLKHELAIVAIVLDP